MTDTLSEGPESALGENGQARIYEVGYLIVPTVTEEELPREVTALKDILEKEKASVISEEFPKLRQLAYTMQKRVSLPAQAGGAVEKYANAYFGWVKFEAKGESAKRINAALKQNAKVLRYILIKTVREQTLVGARPPRIERGPRKEVPKDAAPSAPVSEVELDKSIEKLIAE